MIAESANTRVVYSYTLLSLNLLNIVCCKGGKSLCLGKKNRFVVCQLQIAENSICSNSANMQCYITATSW